MVGALRTGDREDTKLSPIEIARNALEKTESTASTQSVVVCHKNERKSEDLGEEWLDSMVLEDHQNVKEGHQCCGLRRMFMDPRLEHIGMVGTRFSTFPGSKAAGDIIKLNVQPSIVLEISVLRPNTTRTTCSCPDNVEH